MKKKKDYGPADFYAEAQMWSGAFFFAVILVVVIGGWIIRAFQ